MVVHNKLEINYKNKKIKLYNNLLTSALQLLQNKVFYNNYLAFGKNSDATTDNQTSLNDYLFSQKSEVVAYNFNPALGQIFLSKKVVLPASLEGNIAEIGIACDDNSSYVVNRFVLSGETADCAPIYKTAGEPIEIVVTTYLQLEETTQLVHTIGDNPFYAFILGYNFNNQYDDFNFYFAKGNDNSSNDLLVSHSYFNGEKYLCSADWQITDNILNINLSSNLPVGSFEEIILLINDCCIFRSNLDAFCSSGTKTVTAIADSNYIVTLFIKGITNVVSCYNPVVEAEYDDVITNYFGLSFGEVNNAPFGADTISALSAKFYNKKGTICVFVVDDIVKAYKLEGKNFIKLDTSAVNGVGVIKIVVQDDFMVIKSFDGTNYAFNVYFLNNYVYSLGTISYSSYASTIGATAYWQDYDVCKLNGVNAYILCILYNAKLIIGKMTVDYDNTAFNLNSYSTKSFTGMTNVVGCDACNAKDGFALSGTPTGYADTSKLALTKNGVVNKLINLQYDEGTLKNSLGSIMSVDSSKIDNPNCILRYFLGVNRVDGEIVLDDDVTSAMPAVDNRYVATFTSNGIWMYYLTYGKEMHKFNSILNYSLNDIAELIIMYNIILIFFNNGSVISIPINDEYITLESLSPNVESLITIETKSTPGETASVASTTASITFGGE